DTDGPDRFSDSQLATMLGTASVTVATSAANTGDEDIVVSSDFDLSWTAANGLTLDAGRDIQLAGSINGGTMGTLALNFGRNLDFGGASLTAMTVSATGGTTGTQAITGPSGGSTWELTATGAGTLTVGTQSVAFSAVENLQGGDGVDAFTVSAAHTGDLMGGGGADTFTLNAALTGALRGDAGADTFHLNAGGSVSLVSGGSVPGVIQGGGGGDIFNLNAAYASTLEGGEGADTFNLNAGGGVTGAVYGGAGADALDFSGLTAAVDLTLRLRPDATGFVGEAAGGAAVRAFAGIGEVRGSAAGTDRATGLGAGGAFQGMATNPTGYAFGGRTLALSGFESTLAGTADVLDLSAQSGSLQVSLSGAGASGYSGSWRAGSGSSTAFSGIREIRGGTSAADVLTGRSADASWRLGLGAQGGAYSSADSGGATRTLFFADLESQQGGSRADEFTVDAPYMGSVLGRIDGGFGNDRLVFNGGTVAGAVDGGGGNDEFFFNGGTVAGAVDGGGSHDDFFFNGGTVAGTVDGGADFDELYFSSLPTGVELTLRLRPDATGFVGEATGGAAVRAFAGIDRVRGSGAGTDRVTGLGAGGAFQGSATNPTRYDFGGRELRLSGFESTLAAAADVLDLSARTGDLQVSLSGAGASGYDGDWSVAGGMATAFTGIREIRGGLSAADVLTGRDADASWRLGLGAQGGTYASADGGGATRTLFFADLESQQGGAQADEFTVSEAYAGTLSGGDGADIFNLNAALTGAANGEAGADRFILGSSGSATALDGGMDEDTFQGRDAVATWTVTSAGAL
ncbi:MAG: hypothetical protein OXU54_06075, partial [Gammaproteobacteria bacterium]|nr:hypothetical protein [Gammaproteobacteria bacterium]